MVAKITNHRFQAVLVNQQHQSKSPATCELSPATLAPRFPMRKLELPLPIKASSSSTRALPRCFNSQPMGQKCLALPLCLRMQPVNGGALQTKHSASDCFAKRKKCMPAQNHTVPPKRWHARPLDKHLLWQACECSAGSDFPSMRKGCRRPARSGGCQSLLHTRE